MENNVFFYTQRLFLVIFFYKNNITEKVYMYSLTFNCIINTKINFQKNRLCGDEFTAFTGCTTILDFFLLIYSINQII